MQHYNSSKILQNTTNHIMTALLFLYLISHAKEMGDLENIQNEIGFLAKDLFVTSESTVSDLNNASILVVSKSSIPWSKS